MPDIDETRFSDADIKRKWSESELGTLSDKQLTVLQFVRAGWNLSFFAMQGLVVWALVPAFGALGTVVGWLAIAQFTVICGAELLGLFTAFTLALTRMSLWRIPQTLISLGNVLYPAGLVLLLYSVVSL